MEKPENIFDLLDETKSSNASEAEVYGRVTEFLRRKTRENNIPYYGHFELTPLCNLDCKMCLVHLTKEQMLDSELLPPETWIDLMRQAKDAGMVSAALSGGECLTYPQFDEIYLFLKANGIHICVLTNGVLLNHERIEFFKKFPPEMVQVSLYGNSDETYERVTGRRVFSTVLENVKALQEAGIPMKLAITPSRYLLEDVKETIRLVNNLNIPYTINFCLLSPRQDTGRELSEIEIGLDDYMDIFMFNRQLKGISIESNDSKNMVPIDKNQAMELLYTGVKCGAGRNMFSIQWNGLMHPCPVMDRITADPLQSDFISAWNYINMEARQFPRFKKCEDCDYANTCRFCPAENEKLGSASYLHPSWCKRTWKMVELGLSTVSAKSD